MDKHSLSHAILAEQIRNKNQQYKHPSYVCEHRLLDAIRQGDSQAAIKELDELNQYDRPILANQPIRSLQNHLIALSTLAARAAIQGGAVAETSFVLNDLIIRAIEEQHSQAKLDALEYDLVQYFVELVQLARHDNYSTPVNKSIRFIRENLHERLTLKQIADEADVSPNYLSNLFSREVSEPPIAYYNRERNQAIKNMLADSNLSMSDIAQTFNFSSVSYFSTAFRKENGMTPSQYRRQRSWEGFEAGEPQANDKQDIFRRAASQLNERDLLNSWPQHQHSSLVEEHKIMSDSLHSEEHIADLEAAIKSDKEASAHAAGVDKPKRRRGRPRKVRPEDQNDQ